MSTVDASRGTRLQRSAGFTFVEVTVAMALMSIMGLIPHPGEVVAGQVIGYMGNTGNTAWNHLHFEIWIGSLTPRFATIVDPVSRMPFPIANVTLRSPTACSD